MVKVSIIGLFCADNGVADGQTVKTNILAEEIERAVGSDQVVRINTYGWKKNPARLLFQSIAAVLNSKNVLFLTDEGGIRVFPRLLRYANLTGKCRIHYYVVGGWLKNYLDRSPRSAEVLRRLDAIYVEIPAMLRELEDRGFRNGVLVNKFRRMTPVSREELPQEPAKPYRLCYFSRVMKEKGVEDCIQAVKTANSHAGFTKYTLDIYGPINAPYQEQFEALKQGFPDFIRYGGIIDFKKSSTVLKECFAMLFPTAYASEGYPNVVVDAFAAGLPVIATRWHYNEDIIRDHVDGILVDVGSIDQLVEAMEELSGSSERYAQMRQNCLDRCREYLPDYAVSQVIRQLK